MQGFQEHESNSTETRRSDLRQKGDVFATETFSMDRSKRLSHPGIEEALPGEPPTPPSFHLSFLGCFAGPFLNDCLLYDYLLLLSL